MKRNLLLLFSLFCAIFLKAQSVTWLSENFENGMPDTFKLYDEDRLTPSSSMTSNYGFKVGVPWIVLYDGQMNAVAVSTSNYAKSGTSNDWMVTSSFKVEKKGASLVWKGMAIDARNADGYSVYISTTGNKVADFTDEPVFTIKNENAIKLTTHSVSLDDYMDKTIYVAFVNNSTNCNLLMIDDIFAGIPVTHTLANATDPFYNEAGDKSVSFEITGGVLEGLDGFTAELSYGDKTVEQTFTSEIKPDQTVKFTFDEKVPLKQDESVNYKITLKAVGNQPDLSVEGVLIYFSGDFDRKVVMEEGTGTWCGWCPRGTVGIREMLEKHPDDFIGIAVHSGDPMQVNEYIAGLSQYVTGFPGAFINRKFVVDPYNGKKNTGFGIEAVFNEEKAIPTIGELTMEASYSAAEVVPPLMNVTLKGKFGFSTEKADLRFAVILLENGVQGNNEYYNQANKYAGGRQGKMGGFEKLPSTIKAKDITYDHVARAIYEDFNGIPNSIPAVINKDEQVTYSCEIQLPDYRQGGFENYVFNYDAVELVGLILDGKTGEIWNAARLKNFEIGGVDAVSNPSVPGFTANPVVTENLLTVEVSSQGRAKVELYSTDGTLLVVKEASVDGQGSISIPTAGLQGVYVVKTLCGDQVAVNKVMIK